jgi:hypothetical protein
MNLLSTKINWDEVPDELWKHGSQYLTMDGYDTNIDVDSLMVLLWKMDTRIKELESKLENTQ